MNEEELRKITAHHEAGHAVAAYVGGGTVDHITITPTADRLGATVMSPKDATNAAFAVHAGPWSEARFQWPLSTFDLNDNYHERPFEGMLRESWEKNRHGNGVPSDGDYWLQAIAAEEEAGLMVVHGYRWDEWSIKLDKLWPAIEHIASLLLQGNTVGHNEVAKIVEHVAPGMRDGA